MLPIKKRSAPPRGIQGMAYIRYTNKMLYFSGPAIRMISIPETISISIDGPGRMMVIRPHGPFKLSKVCETEDARRIETNNALASMIEAGFPRGMVGKYLTLMHVTMDGALAVSLMVDYDKATA